jgi:hypothetical protein
VHLPLQHWPLPVQLVPFGLQQLNPPPDFWPQMSGGVHVMPQAPQLGLALRGVHTPLQQPWPLAHALPQVPQLVVVLRAVHTPLQQPWPLVQAAQTAPPVPQNCVVFPCRHVLIVASQQPLGQVAGVHMFTHEPFWHSVPAGQDTQAAPPNPQAVLLLPGLQVWVVASQHPLQLAVVHTQVPPWHARPNA